MARKEIRLDWGGQAVVDGTRRITAVRRCNGDKLTLIIETVMPIGGGAGFVSTWDEPLEILVLDNPPIAGVG